MHGQSQTYSRSPTKHDASTQSPKHKGGTQSHHSGSALSTLLGQPVPQSASMSRSIPTARTRRTGGSSSAGGSASSSRQGSRANSPLDLPMETLQSLSAVYNLGQGTYLEPGYATSPIPSPSSRSPYQSPTHSSRSNSTASMKNLVRDRSADRLSEREALFLQQERNSTASLDRHGYVRESLPRERRGAALRDRSLDRDYPYMGARSLERDYAHHKVSRSRSIEQESTLEQQLSQLSQLSTSLPSKSQAELNSMLHPSSHRDLDARLGVHELQAQLSDANRESANLMRDLDATKEKLSSCMNSIKTFWSPELKKERTLRKEENSKYNTLNEQYKVAQAEIQRLLSRVREIEESGGHQSGSLSRHNGSLSSQISDPDLTDTLKRDKEKQIKEIKILRKTVEEMELRIETQKQTLNARDESIKKLLEMLQSKGLGVKQLEDDRLQMEKLRTQVIEDEQRMKHTDRVLTQKEKEISALKDELANVRDKLHDAQIQLQSQPANTASMQAMLEAKDSRISALEIEVRLLEDELLRMKEESSLGDRERKDGTLKREMAKTQDKSLRIEVEMLKVEVAKKENEMCGLRLKAETLEKQQAEHRQYIQVLKEQIGAKERHCSLLQADIQDLRERLREKDSGIEKKSKQVQSAQADKRRTETEIAELKDHLDIKDRKVVVLQRKIENLEETLAEKESQLVLLRSQLETLPLEQSSHETAIAALHEAIAEKERQIDRLKEQREKSDTEHQEECEVFLKQIAELKSRLETLQSELTDKQTELFSLREETSVLKSDKFQAESHLKQTQLELMQMSQDLEALKAQQIQVEQERQAMVSHETQTSEELRQTDQKVTELTATVDGLREELTKSQTELDRLLEILKVAENEKHSKDEQIKDMTETIKDYKQKMGTLKRNQQTEKKKSAHLLEEARKREDDLSGDSAQLKNVMKQKEDRIEELEEALRQSVRITAEREMVMAEQQGKIDQTQKQIEELNQELTAAKQQMEENAAKVEGLTKQLSDREAKVKRMQAERRKHMEEVYEMKQEATQAAICEKDANIALLELTSTKKIRHTEQMEKLNQEKRKLQEQLKEITQNRMRLMQTDPEHSHEKKKEKGSLAKAMKSAPPDQVIRVIRKTEHSKKRLQTLIDQLVAACLDIDPQLLEGLPRLQLGLRVSVSTLRSLSREQLLFELHRCDTECKGLQSYANILLQRLGSVCPEIFDSFLMLLESSDTESCTSACESV